MVNYTYIALGDSYTIGEQVALLESFPYQAVQLLRKLKVPPLAADPVVGLISPDKNLHITAPEIIAKTGWTTNELLAAVNEYRFLPAYDFVSLLIGVNNQYRGGSTKDFRIEFLQLLQKAIQLTGGNRDRVFVLSIPDWGLTPFASGKDREKISTEIDSYNDVCKAMAEKEQCVYIDITTSQRMDVANEDFLAADTLHPSGKEYAKWASKLANAIRLSVQYS